VPIDRKKSTKALKHVVGGEPLEVPVCSYLSREEAFRIIDHFIKYKVVPDDVEWIKLYDINFDNEFCSMGGSEEV